MSHNFDAIRYTNIKILSGASQRFCAPERAQACDLEMNLQVLSIYEFLVDLTQLELTEGKERVKMLRFTLKAHERL